jgi:ribosomal protein S3
LQTLRFNLSYSFSVSYTKFGTISIKVWLLNGNTLI